MPVGDFTAALTERVDYAIFVAYETWARETAYTAHNPYDVLARLLDGLPQALSTAMAERGGWVTLDPAGGVANGESRMLINEMAAQVMVARIQAEAADVPDIGLLTGLIVDAVSGAITLFIEQPGSFDLARAEEAHNAPLGSRTQPNAAPPSSTVSDGQPDPEELAALPEGPEVAAATTETEEAAAPATTEAWLAPLLHAFLQQANPGSSILVLGADGLVYTYGQDGTLDLLDLENDWAQVESVLSGDDKGPMPGFDFETDPLQPDGPVQRTMSLAAFERYVIELEEFWFSKLEQRTIKIADASDQVVFLPDDVVRQVYEDLVAAAVKHATEGIIIS